MQIELLRLPYAIYCNRIGERRLVRCLWHRVDHARCGCHMRAVSVFAVEVVGDDHLRLKAANLLDEKLRGLLLAPVQESKPERLGIDILERQKHGCVAHAGVPESV